MECQTCGRELEPGTRFCPSCGTPVASVPAEEEAKPDPRERKIATLLFADIVGFTPLNESQDPEVVQALVGRAFDRLSVEVRRYEGLIEKFAGDAMLAVFGVPTIHEDDAERAVRGALEMQQAMLSLEAELKAEGRAPLSLRIGVETGEVVADTARASAERDRLVIGDAVNTAARLQQAAAPGTVVVGPGTYAATRELFVYDELEPIALKGKTVPVPAWHAVAVKTRRGGQRQVLGLEAPLIGRDEEVNLLKETIRRTVPEQRPHLVTVLGSAGVGKSRLSWELEKYLDGLPELYHWRKGRCLAYGQASYSALADALAADASVLDDDAPEEASGKVERRLKDLAGGEAPPHLLVAARALLGIGEEGQLSRDELFEAWREYVELVARRAPLVLVLEDIHWADEGLLDFIEFLSRWAEAPIMLLCLARHELLERRPTWGGGMPNAATIVLEPLDAAESRRLLEGLLGGQLADDLRDRVVEVADGNPLFAEELIRLLVDRGVLRFTDGAWEQVRPLEEIEIPMTIQALLAARLDSLPAEEKGLSQDAAVVGRIFWDRVVAHLSGRELAATSGLLRRLRAKELVVTREPSSLGEAAEFSFRHVLIRDVAYESLPKTERARKHRAVAQWAEERLGERREELVELLASHYASALRYEEEFVTQETEALVALRRKTLEHAVAAAERAKGLWQPGTATKWRKLAVQQGRRLQLSPGEQGALLAAYIDVADGVDPLEETVAAAGEGYRLLAEHAERQQLTSDELDTLGLLASAKAAGEYSATSDAELARATVRTALELLDRAEYQGRGRAFLLHRLGWLYWRPGPAALAVEPLEQAIAIARATGSSDVERWALHDLGLALSYERRIRDAVELVERSMQLALEANDRPLVQRCRTNLGSLLIRNGAEFERPVKLLEEGLQLARRNLDRGYEYWLAVNLASAYAEMGRLAEALPLHAEARKAGEANGFYRVGRPEHTYTLALMGRTEAARSLWDEAKRSEGEPEPQMIGMWQMLDAIFEWPVAPTAAVNRLSAARARFEDSETTSGAFVYRLLARMAARTGQLTEGHLAVDALRRLRDDHQTPLLAAAVEWIELVVEAPSADSVSRLVTAADRLEALGGSLYAAEALADAVLLAARAGLPTAELAARAAALHEACGAVPLLEPLPDSVSQTPATR